MATLFASRNRRLRHEDVDERIAMNMLLENALYSIASGEGLEGFTDEELVALIGESESLLTQSIALDIYGNLVKMPTAKQKGVRALNRTARRQLAIA